MAFTRARRKPRVTTTPEVETGLKAKIVEAGDASKTLDIKMARWNDLAEASITDEMRELQQEIDFLNKTIREREAEVRDEMEAGAELDSSLEVNAGTYSATLGKASKTRTIVDKRGLLDLLEDRLEEEEVLALVKLGLGDLERAIGENSVAPFLTESREGGARSFSIKAKPDKNKA